jgi:glutamate-1-semialdehyde 2,1-aminomutase
MLGLPGSVGVSAGAVADTEVVPYNVVPELDARVACVIVEPVAANMNLVAPVPGFLEGLRAACDASGALLIFDEVISGFRLGPQGATGWSGVTPDLWCFGKVIGGGLPVGAFGGSRSLMSELAPGGPVYQAGTLSGNPLATAAGLAVLEHVGPSDYDDLTARVGVFAKELEAAVAAGGLAVVAPTVGPLAGLFVSDAGAGALSAPSNYEEARALAGGDTYARFFHAMLRRGVALAPGAYEVMFPGMAHDEAVLDRVVEAAGEAAAEVS